MPTGIVVACQADRSQHRNRAMAMDMLKARLYEAELQKREEAAAAQEALKSDIGWGHQIRSYVLQPYQMVKDLRTETSRPATPRACSTATSTASSPPRWPPRCMAASRPPSLVPPAYAISAQEIGALLSAAHPLSGAPPPDRDIPQDSPSLRSWHA